MSKCNYILYQTIIEAMSTLLLIQQNATSNTRMWHGSLSEWCSKAPVVLIIVGIVSLHYLEALAAYGESIQLGESLCLSMF